MADAVEKLKKEITELKARLAEAVKAAKDPKKDALVRTLRKKVKRAQRRLRLAKPVTLQEKLTDYQKRLDTVGKLLSDLTKNAKKSAGDPWVHSLRKKTKSMNRRIKKVNRLIAKQPKPAEAAPSEAAAAK